MNHEEDELRVRVADRRISAISLDTSVFDKLKNGFEYGLLARMAQFRDTDIRVVLSDVVAGEVRRHLIRDGAAAETALGAALKGIGGAWALPRKTRTQLAMQAVGGESVEAMAERRLNAFKESVNAEVVESGERVDLRRLLSDYFGSVSPFGVTAAKKNEFPDAIALQALEHWAKQSDTELLVVSSDGDWLNFCSTSEHLVCVSDLATALGHFHQDAALARVRIAKRLASGEIDLDAELADPIKWAADSIDMLADGNAAYRFEADIYGVDVIDRTLVSDANGLPQLTIVDSGEGVITLEAEATVKLSVTARFSFSTTDPFDKDEIRIGSCSVSQQVERTAKLLLTFELSSDGKDSLVETEATFEGGTDWIEFGEVEPDWVDDGS